MYKEVRYLLICISVTVFIESSETTFISGRDKVCYLACYNSDQNVLEKAQGCFAHRQPRCAVSEINLQTTEPNMYVKLQAKLTAKESKYLSNSSK